MSEEIQRAAQHGEPVADWLEELIRVENEPVDRLAELELVAFGRWAE